MQIKKLFVCGVIAVLPLLAHAQLDCVVPTREEGFDPKQPGAAELQRAARAAAAIVQKNAVFMAGNAPVRIRSTISYGGWDRQTVSVTTTAYNKKAWLASGCTISKFSDRGGGLSDGTIALYINSPESMFGGELGDGDLKASGMPTRLGNTAGFPIYAIVGDASNPRVLISRAGYEPWVPVTISEMLGWRERQLRKREKEQSATQQATNEFNEAIYRGMKQVNPAEAEKARTHMLASLEKMRSKRALHGHTARDWIANERSAFDAYRASFSAAQLAEPGTISNALTRDKVVRVDDPVGKPLAKVDPGYAKRDPRRIHLIVVSLALPPKTSPNFGWFHSSLEALDFAALAKLLSE
jgi:hypothetical protein